MVDRVTWLGCIRDCLFPGKLLNSKMYVGDTEEEWVYGHVFINGHLYITGHLFMIY